MRAMSVLSSLFRSMFTRLTRRRTGQAPDDSFLMALQPRPGMPTRRANPASGQAGSRNYSASVTAPVSNEPRPPSWEMDSHDTSGSGPNTNTASGMTNSPGRDRTDRWARTPYRAPVTQRPSRPRWQPPVLPSRPPNGQASGLQTEQPVRRVVLIERCGGVQVGRDNYQHSVYRISLPSVALKSSLQLAEHLLDENRGWSQAVFSHNARPRPADQTSLSSTFHGVSKAAAGDTLVLIRNSRGVQVGDGNTQHNTFRIRVANVAVSANSGAASAVSRTTVDRLCERPSRAMAEELAGQVARAAQRYLEVDLEARVHRDVGHPSIAGFPSRISDRTGVQAGGSSHAHVTVRIDVSALDHQQLADRLLEEARHRAQRTEAARRAQERERRIDEIGLPRPGSTPRQRERTRNGPQWPPDRGVPGPGRGGIGFGGR
jgi:hypothetical protein